MLFLAVCAYLGAALYEKLNRELETVEARRVTVSDYIELTGIAVRQEQLVCSSAALSFVAEDAVRLPAGGEIARLGDGSSFAAPYAAFFFSDYDGLEGISPALLDKLSVSSLESLLDEKATPLDGVVGRLVRGYTWYFAALADAGAEIDSGSCRILFAGQEQSEAAQIISVSPAENGKLALVLRLSCQSREYMSLRKCSARLILSEHTGIQIPEEAVMKDDDGNNFVYTLTAGIVERKAVEIIYKAEGSCIAAMSSDAQALREGNTLIVSGEDIYVGRIIGP